MSEVFHEEEVLGRAYDARLMRRLLGWLRPYRWWVAAAVAMLFFIAALQVVGPYLTKVAIDRAIPARDTGHIARLGLLFIAALVAEFALEYAQAYVTARIGQRTMYDLRLAIFAHLQRLQVAFYDRNPVGRLMTRLTSDVETLNEMFTSGVVALFGDLFTLVAIMVMMLVVDWRLALAAVAVIPLVGLAALVFRLRVRDAYREIRVRVARINAFLQERLTGMRIVQLFARERETARRFDEVNRAHLDAHLRSITIYAVFFPVIEVLTSVALASLLLYGGHRVLGHTVTVGVLAAFLQLVRRFFRPLQDLSEKYNIMQSAMASSERIFRLLDRAPTITDPAVPRGLPLRAGPRGRVAFEDVWFRYDGDWVLRGISFVAEPGETVAIVGHTGAGKTTIINLLLRFYDPQRGRVTVDGVDVRDLEQRELRGLIGLVQQDIFLFTGDIRRNIALGGGVSREAAEAAARRVGADRFIARLPRRYEHELGERGHNLSVGERQLLAFARALAPDPVILVLDEATSSVDAETEAAIQRGLEEIRRGRTSLVVAHRLSTVQRADRTLVLHHGEIVQRGTHRSLLAEGGIYEQLYQLQLGPGLAAAT